MGFSYIMTHHIKFRSSLVWLRFTVSCIALPCAFFQARLFAFLFARVTGQECASAERLFIRFIRRDKGAVPSPTGPHRLALRDRRQSLWRKR